MWEFLQHLSGPSQFLEMDPQAGKSRAKSTFAFHPELTAITWILNFPYPFHFSKSISMSVIAFIFPNTAL